MTNVTGGCLCGRVRVTASGEPASATASIAASTTAPCFMPRPSSRKPPSASRAKRAIIKAGISALIAAPPCSAARAPSSSSISARSTSPIASHRPTNSGPCAANPGCRRSRSPGITNVIARGRGASRRSVRATPCVQNTLLGSRARFADPENGATGVLTPNCGSTCCEQFSINPVAQADFRPGLRRHCDLRRPGRI